ncbi:unnamed protein product, partial [Lymnaea stagnalis]
LTDHKVDRSSTTRPNMYSTISISIVEHSQPDNGLYSMADSTEETNDLPSETMGDVLYDVPKTPKLSILNDQSVTNYTSKTNSYNNIDGVGLISTTKQITNSPELTKDTNQYVNTATLDEIVHGNVTRPHSPTTEFDPANSDDVYYSKA